MTLRGSPQLHARLRALRDIGTPVRKAWATETASRARNKVRVRSGKTRATIRETGGKVEAGGGARFLEKGTTPHVIEPVKMSVLKWNEAGLPRFARKVRHPGAKRQPFLRPAAVEALDKVGNEVIVSTWNRAA